VPTWILRAARLVLGTILLVVGVLPFGRYVQSWPRGGPLEQHAVEILRREMAVDPNRRYVLVCADTRSSDFLDWYWGYRYPQNLDVLSPDRIRTANEAPDTPVYFYVHQGRARALLGMYGIHSYDDVIKAKNYPLLFQASEITIYKTSWAEVVTGGF
jgi:hypothetical protein